MKLDRAYQRELLEELAASYPERVEWRSRVMVMDTDSMARYQANLAYLHEHGLVSSEIDAGLQFDMSNNPKITARGMDFLADDGGLSAILGVVTVKLHEDTLKEVIGQKITESDLPAPEKNRLLDQIKSLPGETIKHLTMKLVDAGLANWPIALQSIEHFVHAPK
ncbi:hypothetical protein PQR72_27645 [Paraburkholderia madseniana]|uniref:hypothetical protein n=1 Tax=Paraburkholderia madseniana TaxID=2599607 RepID=UPI0015C56971|nr:hypothetical protein [Paraburkholderia madseniana]NPT68071.1 hypothetical protein [Paraburkholderia madseniana]